MSNEFSKDELIHIMFSDIKELSNTLNLILEKLLKLVEDRDSSVNSNDTLDILTDLEKIIEIILKIEMKIPSDRSIREENKTLKLYSQGIGLISQGIKLILNWLKEKSDDISDIDDAIDNILAGTTRLSLAITELLED